MTNTRRAYLEVAPWMALFPGAAVFVTVLGFNPLVDSTRDLFDSRLRN